MKRNRRAGVEDRWTKTVRDDQGNTQKVPSAVDGKGLRWRARYVGPDGKERAKHFARKTDAQAWVDGEVTTKIGTHTWVDPSLSREVFTGMAEAWFATKASKSPKTKAGYRSILDTVVLPRWGDVRLADITFVDVQTWISGLSLDGGVRFANGLSPSRVVQSYQVLNMVFKYAIRARRLVVNPSADVEKPTITPPGKRYLDHQQVQELAVASGRFRTLVLVLAYSGLRFGEAVALRRRDIDLDEARIWVTKSATHVAGEGIVENNTTKRTRASSRSTDRKVPIPASVVELLRTELPTDLEALVFPGRKGTGAYLPLGEFRWAFDKGLGAVRSEANAKRRQEIEETGKATTKEFPAITPHELRHTCASLAIRQAGANIKVVQNLLGHKSATMTLDRYGHLYPDDLDAVAQRLDEGAREAADRLRTTASSTPRPNLHLAR